MTEHGMLTLNTSHTKWHVEWVPSHLIYFLSRQLTSGLFSIYQLLVSSTRCPVPSSGSYWLIHCPSSVLPFWLHPTTSSILCPSEVPPLLQNLQSFASRLSATQTLIIEILRCSRFENTTEWFKVTVQRWGQKENSKEGTLEKHSREETKTVKEVGGFHSSFLWHNF